MPPIQTIEGFDMPIKQVFEKREDAPEFLRGALLEADGKFVFEAETVVEVAGLKSSLEKERKLKADFEKALKGYEGVDPEEARRLKTEAEQVALDKLKSKGDWETREKQLQERLAADLKKHQDQYAGELAKREEREKLLQQSLERHLIEAQATAAIAAAGGVPELLLPHVKSAVKVVEENGQFVARVIDANGQPRIANVKGDPYTISHLVEEMKGNQVFGRAFAASGAGGSGAQNNTAGSGGGQFTLSREQAKDPQTYRAAKEAAAKAGATVQIAE
jgi:hypothetical protein